jgi:antitoxin component YwqK of YwqJK toxin-antitoxin module
MVKMNPLILLFLVVSINCLAQNNNDINQLDETGKKHGIWVKKYTNGQIRYKGEFKHGNPTGEFKRYFPNGKLKAIMQHRSDGEVYATLFNEEGEKKAEGKYVNKKKDSIWVFYGSEGNVVLRENFDMGKRNGKSVKLYPNGDTSEIVTYRNGIKHGVLKQFFPEGNLQLLARYQNDELDGHVTIFTPQGYKEIEGLYRDGLREGKWVYYKNATDTARVLKYKNGEPLNKDSIEVKETQEIIRLENKEGKFGDPRDELMPSRRRKRRQ